MILELKLQTYWTSKSFLFLFPFVFFLCLTAIYLQTRGELDGRDPICSSNFVANDASLSNALTHKEPESNLCRDQGVQPSLLNITRQI